MPSIEIDGKQLQVRDGIKIIEAADEAGIYIPRFCYHRKLTVAANCRMCLVEVEKAPKPLPACATTVSDGMKVSTRSSAAREAQKSTMEFLLINHPLDCPICDQGGECPLQDQALGYGKDVSRFTERKRAVVSPDMGPLIATEMTRCIHCTRCVRFGNEIAGVMELGMLGRGDRSSIHSFLDEPVNSELSGNIIDLCPVGALTSKPYRFTARVWELSSSDGISPHDCVGSNLTIQSVRGQVKRVLPVVNETINDCWLSDRDRYSYVGNNSGQRLLKPMIRVEDQWREVSWQVALDFTVTGIRGLIERYGAEQLGALAAPGSTAEEFYLLQKLLRALGSGNIDHRLRQVDFSADEIAPLRPGMELGIEEIATAQSLLLVGANPRKDQPIIGLNIRRAGLAGARIAAINSMHWQHHFALETESVVVPDQLCAQLASVLLALDSKCGAGVEALAARAPA
ncbi:MAG TPA: NADH dehydrogenase (quinone) subunit G, partial [Gammaproteobacteria bacterium]|nr:NADH dehydrogenase (quinone) subunit G [Gammaproteobacteria bacterium]